MLIAGTSIHGGIKECWAHQPVASSSGRSAAGSSSGLGRMQCALNLLKLPMSTTLLRRGCNHFHQSYLIANKRAEKAGGVPSVVGRIAMDATPAASTSEAQVLEGVEDRYDGMIVQADLLPSTVEEFRSRLEASILQWKAQVRWWRQTQAV